MDRYTVNEELHFVVKMRSREKQDKDKHDAR